MSVRGCAALGAAVLLAFAGCGDGSEEQAELTPAGERFARFLFTDVGASKSETECAVDALTKRVGAEELNAMPKEFKAGNPKGFEEIRFDVIEADRVCDVDDHREANCEDPRTKSEREVCEIFREIETPGGPTIQEMFDDKG